MSKNIKCKRCGEYKLESNFLKNYRNKSGLSDWCSDCEWLYNSKLSYYNEDLVECIWCKQLKPQIEFHKCGKDKEGKSLFHRRCRQCISLYSRLCKRGYKSERVTDTIKKYVPLFYNPFNIDKFGNIPLMGGADGRYKSSRSRRLKKDKLQCNLCKQVKSKSMFYEIEGKGSGRFDPYCRLCRRLYNHLYRSRRNKRYRNYDKKRIDRINKYLRKFAPVFAKISNSRSKEVR